MFFVNVGADCGLTIAGFYYVCFDRQVRARACVSTASVRLCMRARLCACVHASVCECAHARAHVRFGPGQTGSIDGFYYDPNSSPFQVGPSATSALTAPRE